MENCLFTVTLLLNSMHKILCPPILSAAVVQPAKEFTEAVGIMVARRDGSIPLIYHPGLHAVSNPANKIGTARWNMRSTGRKGRQSRGVLCENSLFGCTIEYNATV
jgi:hypothetical protein